MKETESTFGLANDVRSIEAARVETPPILDGRLDDACWQTAQPVTGFLALDSDRPASFGSEAFICYDQSHIYIGVKCSMPEGSSPSGQLGPHDSYLFGDDIIEIMLDPGRTYTDYFQFVVNAYGSTFDTRRYGGGARHDPSWNGDWRAAAYIGSDWWSVEIAIPFHTLDIKANVGPIWGLNICRGMRSPRELSSIGKRGAFNDAKSFAVLKGLHVDFGRYLFRLGPGIIRLDADSDTPQGIFTLPVANESATTRKVNIERCYMDDSGSSSADSRVITLEPGETADAIALESLNIEPLSSGRMDVYIVRSAPRTKKIVLRDAQDGTMLSVLSPERPWLFEAMRIEVDDPWQKDTPQSGAPVCAKINLQVCGEHSRSGELHVTLVSKDTSEIVAAKRVHGLSPVTEVVFPAVELPWGAYDLKAELRDSDARVIIGSSTLATVLPGGKYQVKSLNNLARELMNAAERGLLGEESIPFMNPRDGWVFFAVSGNGTVTLDGASLPPSQLDLKHGEAMRRMPAGRYTLRVDGTLDQLIVRSIPEIVYCEYPTGPGVPGYDVHIFGDPAGPKPKWSEGVDLGIYDWNFLSDKVLRHCNMVVGNPSDDARVAEWTASGRRWIVPTGVLGYHVAAPGVSDKVGVFASADECYRFWTSNQGFQHPLTDGVIADEFSSASEEQFEAWTDALRMIAANPEFRGRVFYPWAGQVLGSDANRLFLKVVCEAGWAYSFYKYLPEQPTEWQARELIRSAIIQTARSCNAEPFGSVQHAIATLGIMSHPPLNQNVNPRVNFKVHMERQFEALANDPSFFGLFGVLWFYSAYSDEENLRWAGRLFRHYCIEGRTTQLSNEPYELTHIENPDFELGTKGWSIVEAEHGSIDIRTLPGYGNLQGRYLGGSMGDTALVTRRSSNGPNQFAQEIRNLIPGKAYSLKMITADYGNVSAGRSVAQADAVSIRLDDVREVPGHRTNYCFTYPNHYFSESWRFEKPGKKAQIWMNYHWHVFRANSSKARLTISDWTGPDDPGGPFGQELMYNFVEIQPYLEEAE